jgi:hypothetical protein
MFNWSHRLRDDVAAEVRAGRLWWPMLIQLGPHFPGDYPDRIAQAIAQVGPDRLEVVIANEPNLRGEDNDGMVDMDGWIDQFRMVRAEVERQAPRARVILPAVNFWDQMSRGENGGNGEYWWETFFRRHRERFGMRPAGDALALHIYGYANVPGDNGVAYWTTDPDVAIREVTRCRNWMDDHGYGGLPLELHEIGAIHAYKPGAYSPDDTRVAGAQLRFLNGFVPWLLANHGRVGVTRVCLMCSVPDTGNRVYPITLYDDARRPTVYAQLWRTWAGAAG